MSPRFGEEKNRNGKTYIYKQDSRGGNHGSWFLKQDTHITGNHHTLNNTTSDFNQPQEKLSDEEATDLLANHVDDLQDIFTMTVSDNPDVFNPFSSVHTKLEKLSADPWDDNNHKDLRIVNDMIDTINRTDINNDEKISIIEKLREQHTPGATVPRRNSWGSETRYTPGECLKNTSDFIHQYMEQSPHRRTREELKKYHRQPPVMDNPGLILREEYLGQSSVDNDYLQVNEKYINTPYYNAAVRAILNNEPTVVQPDDYDQFDSDETYFLDDYERQKMDIISTPQLRLLSVFPNRELKEAMEKYNIENVEVRSFANGREYGNVYTVMQPNGNTMSFSVYEHRNTDGIIINGKENWDHNSGDLPYAGGKYDFFADIPWREYNQAADCLCFFMKEAQKGELDDTNTLVKNAPTVDRNTELAKQIPAFKKFLKEYAPEEHDRVDKELSGKKTDDDILRGLDF